MKDEADLRGKSAAKPCQLVAHDYPDARAALSNSNSPPSAPKWADVTLDLNGGAFSDGGANGDETLVRSTIPSGGDAA